MTGEKPSTLRPGDFVVAAPDFAEGAEEGNVYQAAEREGAGWTLDLVAGRGPDRLCVPDAAVARRGRVIPFVPWEDHFASDRQFRAREAWMDAVSAAPRGDRWPCNTYDHLLLTTPLPGQEPRGKAEVFLVLERVRQGWNLKAVLGEGPENRWVADEDARRHFRVITEEEFQVLWDEADDRDDDALSRSVGEAVFPCRVGDHLVVCDPTAFTGPDGAPSFRGDVYQAEARDGDGWGLRLSAGRGPRSLRVPGEAAEAGAWVIPFIEHDPNEPRAAERLRRERMDALETADLEAQAHETWACQVGDLFEPTVAVSVTDGEYDEDGEEIVVDLVPAGQVYRVAARFGRGWDFVRVSGQGPDQVRTMNWEVADYWRPLPRDATPR